MARNKIALDGETTIIYTVEFTQIIRTPSDENLAEKFITAAMQKIEKDLKKINADNIKIVKTKRFDNIGD